MRQAVVVAVTFSGALLAGRSVLQCWLGMGAPKSTIGSADTLAASSSSGGASLPLEAPPVLAQRYELLGFLGAGGMGAVYRVRDRELGEVVALKMLRPELSRDPLALERFRREVTIARRVTHDNVARTFDIGDHEGEKFLTMECVEGGSLAERIGGALSEEQCVEIALAICAGVGAAHRAGVVHRDLKPENVLFARDGRVVVTDFGIAHGGEGNETSVIGTPAYMAPEQLSPGPVDARADIYALGAVLFEMLTGEPAWSGESVVKLVAERLLAPTPPDPRRARKGVSDALAAITIRCMAVAPADRFGSTDEIAAALRGITAVAKAAADAPEMPRPTRVGKTVAVLPFSNQGPEEDQYLAEGVTGDLIDSLSMTRGLLVRPRAVVARVRTADRALDEIARELSVQVVVEGSIRRVGARIRLGVRVVGAEDGFQLWAQRFDSALEDLLVTGDEAARAIAHVLTTELPKVATASASSPEAIELYMRAKQIYWRMWHKNGSDSAKLFERALELAPSDPKIVAAAAQARLRMLFFGEGDRATLLARCRELTERAVAMAPELGDAWCALAGQRLHGGDVVGSARALRSGLTHAPNSPMLQDMVGRLLAEITPVEEGIARLEIALGLDPTMISARLELARAHALTRDWDRADAVISAADSLALALQRARHALWRGEPCAVVEAPSDSFARLYPALNRATGLTQDQRDFMQRREASAAGRMRTLMMQRTAEVLAFMGERDEAIATIARAVDHGLIDLAWFDLCALFDGLRDDARFAPLRAILVERTRAIRDALRRD